MAGLLALIFWITLVGANDLSALLSRLFFSFQPVLDQALLSLHFPDWIRDAFVHGVYQVLAWVVSVMLPPMAIFFPLFTLLEDSGYLPRIAYNLDRPFQCCKACGKQALTMAMGFGCNAAGITGCRIIDSPRERLIAMITNSFVPCNGRLPLFITLILLFLSGNSHGLLSSAASALLLTLFILSGIAMTFITSYLLSATILKGVSSSFYLRASPLQEAPDRQSDLSLGNRPDPFRPWKSCRCSCSCRFSPVDHGKYSSGKYKPSCTFQPVFRPSWTSYGDGRGDLNCLYPGTSGKRNRSSYYPYGLHSPGKPNKF